MSNPIEAVFGKIADKLADVFAEEGARTRAQLQAGLTQTLNAARIRGARPAPIGAGGRLATGRGRLVGWSLRETGGTNPAVVTVYAGSDNTDPTQIIAAVPLAAAGGAQQLPSGEGVFFAEGVTVTVSGAVTGALYFAPAL